MQVHKTSVKYKLAVTKIKQFLNQAGGWLDYVGVPHEWNWAYSEEQTEARLYLRTICRLYLSDFVCAGYELPQSCRDLIGDVDEELQA